MNRDVGPCMSDATPSKESWDSSWCPPISPQEIAAPRPEAAAAVADATRVPAVAFMSGKGPGPLGA